GRGRSAEGRGTAFAPGAASSAHSGRVKSGGGGERNPGRTLVSECCKARELRVTPGAEGEQRMYTDVRAINEMVQRESAFVDPILHEVRKVIVGQDEMIERILIGLLTGGHVLLEGVPGLAKTLTVK